MARVEFIGLPGAGKSTIRKELVDCLRRQGPTEYLTMEEAFLYVSRSHMDRVYRSIMKTLPNVIAVRLCKKLVNRSLMQFDAQNRFLAKWGKSLESFLMSSVLNQNSIKDKEIMISGFLETGALYECIDRGLDGDKVVFYEEGLIQKSFMFIPIQEQINIDQASLTTYLEHIPLPHLVIYVRAGAPLCHKRMLHRPRGLTGRLSRCETNTIMSFLEKADTHLVSIASWLKENPNVHLIEVNNNEELRRVVEYLGSEISTWVCRDIKDGQTAIEKII